MPNKQPEDNASFILVMGVTGAGKSYFINKIAGKNIVGVGDELKACTQEATAVPVNIGREKVLLVDTPGFDDTVRSDAEILTEISRLLAYQYQSGLQLKGVIFLHRITDVRMQGSSMKTLKICIKICGKEALKNVVLVTTRWNEVDHPTGARREQELRSEYWKYMLDFGSTMMRYHGDQDSAVAIASQLLNKESVVLELQRELVDDGKLLSNTAAGQEVNDDIEKVKAQYAQELAELTKLRNELMNDQISMKLDFQRELDQERKKLELAQSRQYAQQSALQVPVGEEVRVKIRDEEKKRSKLGRVLPWLPMTLSILGAFVGVPPGATDMLTSWFADTSMGEGLADMFSF